MYLILKMLQKSVLFDTLSLLQYLTGNTVNIQISCKSTSTLMSRLFICVLFLLSNCVLAILNKLKMLSICKI